MRAKEDLDGTVVAGMRLKLAFARPTRCVVIRGLPDGFERGFVMRALQHWIVQVKKRIRGGFLVTFERLSDAQEAVQSVKQMDGYEVSYDFVKENIVKSRSRSPSPSRNHRNRSRSRSISRSRKRERSWSKGRGGTRSPSREPSKGQRNWSPSSQSESVVPRYRSVSPIMDERKEDDLAEQRVSVEEKKEDVAPNIVNIDEPCQDCVVLLDNLKRHVAVHHVDGPISLQKAAVQAWFECHYTKTKSVGETPSIVPRRLLLNQINIFLEHMGWPQWKAQSNMYKDWFLPEIMGVKNNDNKGRAWVLYEKDGFAPASDGRGSGDKPKNLEQRIGEFNMKFRQFLLK